MKNNLKNNLKTFPPYGDGLISVHNWKAAFEAELRQRHEEYGKDCEFLKENNSKNPDMWDDEDAEAFGNAVGKRQLIREILNSGDFGRT